MWLDAGAFRAYASAMKMKETRGARWVLILSFWMLSCSAPTPAEELDDRAPTSEGSEPERHPNPASEPADEPMVAEPNHGAEPLNEDDGGTPEEVIVPADVTSAADAGPSGEPAPSAPEPSSTPEAAPPSSPAAGTVRTLDLADYRDRLTGMWIAECLANWTGLQREGAATSPGEFHESSANNQMAPDEVSVELQGEVDPGWPSAPIDAITDGLEFDYSGRDRRLDVRDISEYPSQEPAPRCVALRSNDAAASVAVVFRSPVSLSGLRFVEGGIGEGGGFWQDPVVEIRRDGSWLAAPLSRPFDPEPAAPYQIHELTFQAPTDADAVRIRERDVVTGFVSVCELDGLLTR